MDCSGCNDSGEDVVLRELNPDALAKGWAPAMRGDLGDCGCAGACNRSGGDAGEAYDFPEDLSHFRVRPPRRRDRPVRAPGSGAKRDRPDRKKDKDNVPDDSETDKLPPDAPVYVDDGIEEVAVHAGALPDINLLLWSLSDASGTYDNPGPSGGSRGGGGFWPFDPVPPDCWMNWESVGWCDDNSWEVLKYCWSNVFSPFDDAHTLQCWVSNNGQAALACTPRGKCSEERPQSKPPA